ncbi:hypothetical protein EC973_003350 [Apophysomyces ossiformis]|uniref:Uncharacterized protein n=1 Tax=Apophysomyces ossiformis TaxID=679940 RepID=A0A8H7BXH8_9FUNG|nr:hypothetical protein EC973_003350 [Apophysomyces ossiformis]
MFTNFGLQRRPTFTYRRRQHVGCYRPTNDVPTPPTSLNTLMHARSVDSQDSPLTSPDSSSETHSQNSDKEEEEGQKENDDDERTASSSALDIFDFPAEEAAEVSLMVVSSRSTPTKLPVTTSVPKKKPRKAPKRTQTRVGMVMERNYSRARSQPLGDIPRQTQQECTIIPANPPPSPPSLPLAPTFFRPNPQRKRKLNLVSRLKGAHGQEIESAFKGYTSFDEEEEDKDELAVVEYSRQMNQSQRRWPEENEESPMQVSYKEQMERELESLMRTEFGEEQDQEVVANPESDRPRYVPENPIHVRVTYKRSGNRASRESNDEMAKLQTILSELRDLDAKV